MSKEPPKASFMVDLETAGSKSGAAILEIGAVEFDPATGEIIREYEQGVELADCLAAGLHAEPETLTWHAENGRLFDAPGAKLWEALNSLDAFVNTHAGELEVWAWGLDFESKILEAAADAAGYRMPWPYWAGRCARTIWKVADIQEPSTNTAHRALADCRAQVARLVKALNRLKKC